MSAIATRWAWRVRKVVSLPPTAHHVLLCLADRHNEKYDCAWPSYADIVERTGLSERTVRRAVEELEGAELVQRSPRLSAHGRKIGLKYTFPSFDTELAKEQFSNSFDRATGEFDPAAEAEEAEASEDDWQWPAVR